MHDFNSTSIIELGVYFQGENFRLRSSMMMWTMDVWDERRKTWKNVEKSNARNQNDLISYEVAGFIHAFIT